MRMRREGSALAGWLFAPVDVTPLVLFRILFGLLIAAETAGSIATGWVHDNLVEPRVAFPMIGFEWLRPPPPAGAYALYALMAACGLLVAAGAFFRVALAAFALLWGAAYVMQTVSYNNHYYLILLLAVLLLATPAHAWASWDARRRPELRSASAPRWCLAALVAQTAIVYVFAAIAKLDADWLDGRALAPWLRAREGWLAGPLLAWPGTKLVLAWGGLAFDALVVPLLLFAPTRLPMLGLAFVFHLANSYVFRIGVFPYLALALCVLFFPGEALRRRFLPRKPSVPAAATAPVPLTARRALTLGALALYFAVQLALPLRHHLYPGDVNWTEEGHRMAWRMMLRSKTGSISFELRHPPSGRRWTVVPQQFLTPKQAQRVAIRPDLIWQFAQVLERRYAAEGYTPVEVRARSSVSLNGGPPQPLVDPDVDLAAVEWNLLAPNAWIVPLREDRRLTAD